MSLLPAGQSLSRFLPDLDELLHDPHAYLVRQPLTIGPRQMYGLGLLFGFAGCAFLLSCLLIAPEDRGQHLGERLALGIGFLLGAGVWLGWSLLMRGHSLVLHPEGVEVKYRDSTVWCPWALFNVDGHAFVPDASSPRVGLTLPIAAEALPFVELRRDDTPLSAGAEIKARQWFLVASDTLVLPARYEIMAGELGELLLLLGRRLGRQLPKGLPPPSSQTIAPLEEIPAVPDAHGWITVSLTRLAFPPQCCACGQATAKTLPLHVASVGDTLMSIFVPASEPLELAIPVCENCQQRLRATQRQGGLRGLILGALLPPLPVLLLAWFTNVREAAQLLILGLLTSAVGGLCGFILGIARSKCFPVEAHSYSPSRGTLRLRFQNSESAARVLTAMRSSGS